MVLGRSDAIAVGTVLLLLSLNCCSAAGGSSNNNNNNNNAPSNNDQNSNDPNPLWVTEKVFMKIRIGDVSVGKIVFGLFFNVCPKTCLNFRTLIEGTRTTPDGIHLAYNGSIFHRTIRNFMIQGGDFLRGDGYGFIDMNGDRYFPDENFDIPHYGAGWLGMANAGPNTNGCQFYVTCAKTPWLDNKHTLFGIVLEGMDVVRAIENNPTGPNDRPIKTVLIEDCGTLPLAQPFTVPRTAVQG